MASSFLLWFLWFCRYKTLKDAFCGLNKYVFIPGGGANIRPLNDFICVELGESESLLGSFVGSLMAPRQFILKKSSNIRVFKQSLVTYLLEYFFFLLNQSWEILSESCKLLGFLILLGFIYFLSLAASEFSNPPPPRRSHW